MLGLHGATATGFEVLMSVYSVLGFFDECIRTRFASSAHFISESFEIPDQLAVVAANNS